MSGFDEAYEQLDAKEGGYVNDPRDSGGETNHGLTARVARANGYMGRMQDMTREEAKPIFRSQYWDQLRLDEVDRVSSALAAKMFPTGVLCGTARVAKWLQRTLNVLNRNETDFADIEADGAMGPMTIAALRAFMALRGADGQIVLLRGIKGFQAVHLVETAERRPKDERYEYGWLSRRI